MPTLEAGRELDERMAAIMGWTVEGVIYGDAHSDYTVPAGMGPYRGLRFKDEVWADWPWSPSAYIRDAWQVVEKMRADGWDMTLVESARVHHEPWDCRWFIQEYKRAIGHGETAPLAICRAALQAVDSQVASEPRPIAG